MDHIPHIVNMDLDVRKPVLGFVNNKGVNQPAHLRSPMNAFVIRKLESIISRLATSEILIFQRSLYD